MNTFFLLLVFQVSFVEGGSAYMKTVGVWDNKKSCEEHVIQYEKQDKNLRGVCIEGKSQYQNNWDKP